MSSVSERGGSLATILESLDPVRIREANRARPSCSSPVAAVRGLW